MRDRWGVQHIYARNTHDLFFAQGYLAAQTRMWQIELWRRNADGRLAEVLGPAYVERDTFARMLKYRGDWDAEFRHYHPEGELIFEAFADGVNAAIRAALAEDRVPIEFKLSGFMPEPSWTAQTVVSRVICAAVRRGAAAELQRALTVKSMGLETARELLSVDPPREIAIPAGLDLEDIVPEILDVMRGLNSFNWKFENDPAAPGTVSRNPYAVQPVTEVGSNNWVLGGAKTLTGKPLLASDPHRALDNPSMRYLVHLVAPGWNVIGMADAGQPGIGIGHNEHVAWGWTNLTADTQDIYIEETDPATPDRYRYKGAWLPMSVHREEIRVRGRDPVQVSIKLTRHGPVLHEDHARRRAYALRMPGSEVGGAGLFLGSFGVMQARNWQEFKRGSAKWATPNSTVYADREGNFAYLAAGWIPVRKNWDGILPVPGKDGAYEWAGYIPAEELPWSLNDERGFYASANNNVLAALSLDASNRFGHEFLPSYRFDRIVEVLAKGGRMGVADMQRLQLDVVSLPARELVSLLSGLRSEDEDVQWAIDRLQKWNYALDKSSVEATVYEYWRLRLTALTYAIKLPPAHVTTWESHELRQVISWLQSPDADFGAEPKASRDGLLLTALAQALQVIEKQAGPDRSTWAWGNLHKARFPHPLLRPGTADILAIPPVPRGGDESTVQNSSRPSERNADQTTGASIMLVLDTESWDRSVALNAPGNEGAAGSPHYQDLAESWGAGEHFPLAFSKEMVRRVSHERVVLEPK